MVYKQTGRFPPELENAPELPDALEYLWRWFSELCEARTSNGFSLNPLSYTEINAWENLNRIRLEVWEVRAIRLLDRILLSHLRE